MPNGDPPSRLILSMWSVGYCKIDDSSSHALAVSGTAAFMEAVTTRIPLADNAGLLRFSQRR